METPHFLQFDEKAACARGGRHKSNGGMENSKSFIENKVDYVTEGGFLQEVEEDESSEANPSTPMSGL